jgi:hypothetical protein
MAFLAPAFLFLAALAGVPLLVHLLRRRVGRTVDFPAVRYLTRMEQEHSRERKLRHRLLLFLRMLAVLALAMAAARPVARLAGLGHAPVALAIVLDNSMSTGAVHDGRAVFDELRADARQLLQSLTPDDRAWLVMADGRVVGGSLDAVGQALEAAKTLGGRGDLAAATRRAVTLVGSGAPRSPVVAIATDGQISAWRQNDGTDSSIAGAVNAAPVTTGDTPVRLLVRAPNALRNAAVVAAHAEPARWTPAGDVSFQLRSRDSTAWRIALDGRTVARGTAKAESPDGVVRLTQRLASAASGWVRGSIEVDADDLRADDTRWFAVRVAPPPSVTTRSEAGPFLSAALNTLVDEKRLARGSASDRTVVTVAGADAQISAGPVLLTAPIDPIRVGEANRTLARLGIPWRFGAIARDLVLARGQRSLDGVQVRLRYPLQYSPGSAAAKGFTDTIATAGGAPWAVSGEGYVLLASPLDPEATDLPLRAAFVPWILDALSRRLGDDGTLITATPGQHLVDRTLVNASALERPDGSLVPLSGERLTVPNESGVYFVRRQAARVGAIVVNAEADESDVRVEAGANVGESFRARVSGPRVGVDSLPTTWRQHVLDQAAGRSLLGLLLAVALIALLAEAWFSRGVAVSH